MNRAVLQVDGLGSVVRQRFDADGNVLERVAYAGCIPLNTAMTEAAVEAALAAVADPMRDRREVNLYDPAGRLTYDGWRWGGDAQLLRRGRQSGASDQYAAPLALGADPRSVRGGAKDRTSDWVYDGLGRLIASVDPTGAVTRQVLDATGNVVQVIRHAGRIEADKAAHRRGHPGVGAAQRTGPRHHIGIRCGRPGGAGDRCRTGSGAQHL